MEETDQFSKQLELLHSYHLALWTEVEAQLEVIRGAQEQIANLRDARGNGDSVVQVRHSAELLSRHVQTLKGRISALGTTVNELDGTVEELLKVLR